ncbi:hypothetical protein EJF36_19080 [Bacillus sp. HMF5848]|uniref:hypothetical protein n=1 Tax=Bacillus sp. HMF5848 TaxID=2495421 RepID=UPI000F7B7607|nr:hypothetical protein [Bacillus sp. HMF5848]RSK28809.1 hypothetical protein EJF36_19080 [Bacillus sp. HMF5848]
MRKNTSSMHSPTHENDAQSNHTHTILNTQLDKSRLYVNQECLLTALQRENEQLKEDLFQLQIKHDYVEEKVKGHSQIELSIHALHEIALQFKNMLKFVEAENATLVEKHNNVSSKFSVFENQLATLNSIIEDIKNQYEAVQSIITNIADSQESIMKNEDKLFERILNLEKTIQEMSNKEVHPVRRRIVPPNSKY